MANSDLKPKKFGYVVQPPPPVNCHHHHPPMAFTVDDVVDYVNKYVDVRVKQLYGKVQDNIEDKIDVQRLKNVVLEQVSGDIKSTVQTQMEQDITPIVESALDSALQEAMQGIVVDWNTVQDKPEIPSRVSQLENDEGYVTENQIPSIPENVGSFNNDVGYITQQELSTALASMSKNMDMEWSDDTI